MLSHVRMGPTSNGPVNGWTFTVISGRDGGPMSFRVGTGQGRQLVGLRDVLKLAGTYLDASWTSKVLATEFRDSKTWFQAVVRLTLKPVGKTAWMTAHVEYLYGTDDERAGREMAGGTL